MPNLAALDSVEPVGSEIAPLAPSVAEGLFRDQGPVDADGLVIPEFWRPCPRRWAAIALSVRQKWSAEYLAKVANTPPPKAKRSGSGATRFTTDYAVRWGRDQGWKLIERERFDHLTKRHHDLEFGVDAMFINPAGGRIGVQGAGKSEKAPHYQRFMDAGGPAKARDRAVTVVYVEFVRGNYTPVLEEKWT
ncbi:hypothetical protein [Fimbriimonas ginsengisoli]|uniref:Uncharacterized protein n=1 Tax=Fimbriimonas ginsengisoli Gsoil 348 TaxID=661478 RepID=A0A068NPL0_FIMGI|nr:hypothetical protein [Fimbriimonas ginsengisoli]AIE83514.1 hypothetical protein OP10G_0146 [Fimbriimonas ginsengisoli Gsoil 348]